MGGMRKRKEDSAPGVVWSEVRGEEAGAFSLALPAIYNDWDNDWEGISALDKE